MEFSTVCPKLWMMKILTSVVFILESLESLYKLHVCVANLEPTTRIGFCNLNSSFYVILARSTGYSFFISITDTSISSLQLSLSFLNP